MTHSFVCVPVYDAFGKMGSNVKGGNEDQPGSLQQCRSALGPTFSGQYCKVSLKQVKTTEKLPNANQQVLMLLNLCRGRWSTLRAPAFPTLARRTRCRRWCCTVSDSKTHVDQCCCLTHRLSLSSQQSFRLVRRP